MKRNCECGLALLININCHVGLGDAENIYCNNCNKSAVIEAIEAMYDIAMEIYYTLHHASSHDHPLVSGDIGCNIV